ncbi:hypothetical protein P43SY_005074 [Pythium insidiosum]|uniref:Uncharacterized protein n=1 Tax=Pythium insidiosum TaxID=114742 RepID=A0AAD5LJV4_PYTIN|nr:hypothetical protein P43SY_005074 [Pythium insidiosum]
MMAPQHAPSTGRPRTAPPAMLSPRAARNFPPSVVPTPVKPSSGRATAQLPPRRPVKRPLSARPSSAQASRESSGIRGAGAGAAATKTRPWSASRVRPTSGLGAVDNDDVYTITVSTERIEDTRSQMQHYMLPDKDRRQFLKDYFQLVETSELQNALRERDEGNEEKQWQTFLDEMKDCLKLYESPDSSKGHDNTNVKNETSFHSDEARIGARDVLGRKYGIKSIAVMHLVKAIAASLVKKPVAAVSYSDVISVWSEQIGDGDTSSGSGALKHRVLFASVCLEVCQACFPPWMRATPSYDSDVQERYRQAIEIGETIGIENFLKRTLETWLVHFSSALAQVETAVSEELKNGADDDAHPPEWLDFGHFSEALAAISLNGLTKGERLEYFEALTTSEGGADYASIDDVIQFIMHIKCSQDGRIGSI